MNLTSTLQSHLGRRYSAEDVATAFAKSKNWVYRNATAIGGVRMGKEWVFFEINMVNCLTRGTDDANTAKKQDHTEEGMVRKDNLAEWKAERKESFDQERSLGLGMYDEAEVERIIRDPDPFNLLAQSHH
ncbi:hypothetical protein [Maridesulfovibrio ferrireducens]|uniref:hypothetical protein n=1 Tax=Maridesulfovibrio ferrireducens TaxID=246191 RepID=UPI001A217A0F|nr:hypothetical protein [Maridesulfovibrio ferrireducens]MBI9110078.1 hypothetical protein [Maridesulfovibrio ferrireducens]